MVSLEARRSVESRSVPARRKELQFCKYAKTVFIAGSGTAVGAGVGFASQGDLEASIALGYTAVVAGVAAYGFHKAKEQLKKTGEKSEKERRREISSYDIFPFPKSNIFGY